MYFWIFFANKPLTCIVLSDVRDTFYSSITPLNRTGGYQPPLVRCKPQGISLSQISQQGDKAQCTLCHRSEQLLLTDCCDHHVGINSSNSKELKLLSENPLKDGLKLAFPERLCKKSACPVHDLFTSQALNL